MLIAEENSHPQLYQSCTYKYSCGFTVCNLVLAAHAKHLLGIPAMDRLMERIFRSTDNQLWLFVESHFACKFSAIDPQRSSAKHMLTSAQDGSWLKIDTISLLRHFYGMRVYVRKTAHVTESLMFQSAWLPIHYQTLLEISGGRFSKVLQLHTLGFVCITLSESLRGWRSAKLMPKTIGNGKRDCA